MVQKLLKKLAFALDKEKIKYMIIGGQAVLLYGSPRLTMDVDITLGIDTDQYNRIEVLCTNLNLTILPENPRDFVEETKVLPVKDAESKFRIDFIFSFTDYEKQALKRVNKILMDSYPVKFASCEDVIIHKMFASRAIDLEDVKSILLKKYDDIDIKYLKNWLKKFNLIPGKEGILVNFVTLLEETNPEI
ncbi:hypothetical protein JXI42_00885 [bacterium]|nr:hypothetical protein [bacterium]